MPNLSKEEAREFIAEIREENGGVTAEDRDFIAAERPKFLRAFRNRGRQIANSMKMCGNSLRTESS